MFKTITTAPTRTGFIGAVILFAVAAAAWPFLGGSAQGETATVQMSDCLDKASDAVSKMHDEGMDALDAIAADPNVTGPTKDAILAGLDEMELQALATLQECDPLFSGSGCWCDAGCELWGDCCPGCEPGEDPGRDDCGCGGPGSWIEDLICHFRQALWILEGNDGCAPPEWDPNAPDEPDDEEDAQRQMNHVLALIRYLRSILDPE